MIQFTYTRASFTHQRSASPSKKPPADKTNTTPTMVSEDASSTSNKKQVPPREAQELEILKTIYKEEQDNAMFEQAEDENKRAKWDARNLRVLLAKKIQVRSSSSSSSSFISTVHQRPRRASFPTRVYAHIHTHTSRLSRK